MELISHFTLWLVLVATALATSPLQTRKDALPTSPVLLGRQDTLTRTLEPTATETQAPNQDSSTENGPTRTIPRLQTANVPIPLAETIGLIMPNPWSNLYTGVNYSFGFVDAVQRPAPTIGGWLRHVQPLLVFSNRTVDVFPGVGPESPAEQGAIPEGEASLCGATAENWVTTYPFLFQTSGWYMFVVNQTWIQPTVANDTCQLPLLAQKSFFASQAFSVRPRPNQTPGPADPTAAYTVFAEVSTKTPTSLPYDKHSATAGEKLAIGLGITGAVIGLVVIGAVIWWVRKKHKMEREILAFSRLSEEDKVAFLNENPDHFLNPNRRSNRRRDGQPPAPPGTMAYAQWYWDQMRQRQYQGWRWSANQGMAQSGYMPSQPGYWGQGVPYNGVPTMAQYGGYPETYRGSDPQPALVYNTRR